MLRRILMRPNLSPENGTDSLGCAHEVEPSQSPSPPLPIDTTPSLIYKGNGLSHGDSISVNSSPRVLWDNSGLEDWEFCVGSILKTTHEEFMKSLPFDIYSRPMFSYYWSAVMNNLGSYLSTHCGISCITNPPIGAFEITFFDKVRPATDLPPVDFSLRLQFPYTLGISAVDFTDGLVKAMYQQRPPKVHSSETGAVVSIERPLIYFANWTRRVREGAGDEARRARKARLPRINLFLCPSSEFEEPRAQAHAFRGAPARWVFGDRPDPEWLFQSSWEVDTDQDEDSDMSEDGGSCED